MRASRPVIGVTGPAKRFPWGWWATAVAIRRAGGHPRHLTARGGILHPASLDAIVIGGGDDIDPALYGSDQFEPPDPERDAFEMQMLEYAQQWKLPTLGICRGAQLLNVVAGGNLYPDVRPLRRRTSNRPTIFPRKRIWIESDSRLGRVFESTLVKVNSLHYQAVNRLGHGFRVVARDRDRIIQAVEREGGPFCVGVQWHPEYLIYRRAQQRIFDLLVAEAGGSVDGSR